MPTINNVRNPKWANVEQTLIDCEIKHSEYGWIPFTASEADAEEHGRLIFAACLAGDFGPIAAYEPPPKPEPDPKLTGIEFDGVMCSATRDDQNGLMAVLMSKQMQGDAFKPTTFFFANGNKLVITKDNIAAFTAVWMPFRQSFFVAAEAQGAAS